MAVEIIVCLGLPYSEHITIKEFNTITIHGSRIYCSFRFTIFKKYIKIFWLSKKINSWGTLITNKMGGVVGVKIDIYESYATCTHTKTENK